MDSENGPANPAAMFRPMPNHRIAADAHQEAQFSSSTTGNAAKRRKLSSHEMSVPPRLAPMPISSAAAPVPAPPLGSLQLGPINPFQNLGIGQTRTAPKESPGKKRPHILNLRNYPSDHHPVGLAIWVVQKIEQMRKEMTEPLKEEDTDFHVTSTLPYPRSTPEKRVSTPTTPVPTSTSHWMLRPDGGFSVAQLSEEQDAARLQAQRNRKTKQRSENWAKNKENDVVARAKLEAKKKFGPDISAAERQHWVQARFKEDYGRLLNRLATQLNSEIVNLPPFQIGFADHYFYEPYSGSPVDQATCVAGRLLGRVLPALADSQVSARHQFDADALVAGLETGYVMFDAFQNAIRVLAGDVHVMQGIDRILGSLFTTKSGPLFGRKRASTSSEATGGASPYSATPSGTPVWHWKEPATLARFASPSANFTAVAPREGHSPSGESQQTVSHIAPVTVHAEYFKLSLHPMYQRPEFCPPNTALAPPFSSQNPPHALSLPTPHHPGLVRPLEGMSGTPTKSFPPTFNPVYQTNAPPLPLPLWSGNVFQAVPNAGPPLSARPGTPGRLDYPDRVLANDPTSHSAPPGSAIPMAGAAVVNHSLQTPVTVPPWGIVSAPMTGHVDETGEVAERHPRNRSSLGLGQERSIALGDDMRASTSSSTPDMTASSLNSASRMVNEASETKTSQTLPTSPEVAVPNVMSVQRVPSNSPAEVSIVETSPVSSPAVPSPSPAKGKDVNELSLSTPVETAEPPRPAETDEGLANTPSRRRKSAATAGAKNVVQSQAPTSPNADQIVENGAYKEATPPGPSTTSPVTITDEPVTRSLRRDRKLSSKGRALYDGRSLKIKKPYSTSMPTSARADSPEIVPATSTVAVMEDDYRPTSNEDSPASADQAVRRLASKAVSTPEESSSASDDLHTQPDGEEAATQEDEMATQAEPTLRSSGRERKPTAKVLAAKPGRRSRKRSVSPSAEQNLPKKSQMASSVPKVPSRLRLFITTTDPAETCPGNGSDDSNEAVSPKDAPFTSPPARSPYSAVSETVEKQQPTPAMSTASADAVPAPAPIVTFMHVQAASDDDQAGMNLLLWARLAASWSDSDNEDDEGDESAEELEAHFQQRLAQKVQQHFQIGGPLTPEPLYKSAPQDLTDDRSQTCKGYEPLQQVFLPKVNTILPARDSERLSDVLSRLYHEDPTLARHQVLEVGSLSSPTNQPLAAAVHEDALRVNGTLGNSASARATWKVSGKRRRGLHSDDAMADEHESSTVDDLQHLSNASKSRKTKRRATTDQQDKTVLSETTDRRSSMPLQTHFPAGTPIQNGYAYPTYQYPLQTPASPHLNGYHNGNPSYRPSDFHLVNGHFHDSRTPSPVSMSGLASHSKTNGKPALIHHSSRYAFDPRGLNGGPPGGGTIINRPETRQSKVRSRKKTGKEVEGKIKVDGAMPDGHSGGRGGSTSTSGSPAPGTNVTFKRGGELISFGQT